MKAPARLSVLALVAVFALVGCGGAYKGVSDQSPTKLLATAKKQLADETYVKVKGTIKDGSTAGKIDIGFAGDTAAGSFTVEGGDVQMLKAGGKAYVKASDEFLRANAGDSADQVIQLINGRWIVTTASDPNFGELASLLSKKAFFADLLKADGKVTKGKAKKVNGVDCVSLEDSEGILYFDKSDGKPIELYSKAKEGAVEFTYDKFAKATAPAADDIVDLSQAGS